MDVNNFLQKTQARCQSKAQQMAKLELTAWNDTHEDELKKHFGFNDKSLTKRKSELTRIAK